jgi:hypothetical protein
VFELSNEMTLVAESYVRRNLGTRELRMPKQSPRLIQTKLNYITMRGKADSPSKETDQMVVFTLGQESHLA